jgi:voltage-gated potassium channel
VRSEEVGTSLRDLEGTLGLRIIRGGTAYGFWRPQVQQLEAGDVIMEIQPTVD